MRPPPERHDRPGVDPPCRVRIACQTRAAPPGATLSELQACCEAYAICALQRWDAQPCRSLTGQPSKLWLPADCSLTLRGRLGWVSRRQCPRAAHSIEEEQRRLQACFEVLRRDIVIASRSPIHVQLTGALIGAFTGSRPRGISQLDCATLQGADAAWKRACPS